MIHSKPVLPVVFSELRHSFQSAYRRTLGVAAVLVMTAISVAPASSQALADNAAHDFALKDGDTVVFFGDSNTEWSTYVKDIENYAILRFPERRIRFINAGLDGDMVSKAFFRMDRDVFARGATVLVVLFGLNDMSWGVYADSAIRQTFFQYTAKVVDAARARHIRTYVLSYPLTAPAIGTKASNSFFRLVGTLTPTDTSLLQRVGDEAMGVSRAHGGASIDVEREMRRVVSRLPAGTRLQEDDGGHLNELGSEILAFAILRGLDAPGLVSSVEIDAKRLRVAEARGTSVSDLRRDGGKIEFNRLDQGLPLTFSQTGNQRPTLVEQIFAPVNGYFLKVTGLPAATHFDVRADDMSLSPKCGFRGEQLGTGINLAVRGSTYYIPKGPWAQQAIALGELTDGKAILESSISYQAQNELDSERWKTMRSRVTTVIDSLSSAQKAIAKPAQYHFELEPLTQTVAGCPQ